MSNNDPAARRVPITPWPRSLVDVEIFYRRRPEKRTVSGSWCTVQPAGSSSPKPRSHTPRQKGPPARRQTGLSGSSSPSANRGRGQVLGGPTGGFVGIGVEKERSAAWSPVRDGVVVYGHGSVLWTSALGHGHFLPSDSLHRQLHPASDATSPRTVRRLSPHARWDLPLVGPTLERRLRRAGP